jgi:hypothetical protein
MSNLVCAECETPRVDDSDPECHVCGSTEPPVEEP